MAKRRSSQPPRRNRPASGPPAAIEDNPSWRLDAARRLWRDGHHAEAFEVYREAIRQEPNNVRVYIQAARAYAEKFDFQQMDQVHDKLIQRAPRHPGVHHSIGETFSTLKLPGRAMVSFERAASLPGALPPTWMELASLYEGAHRLDEASELIERTLAANFDLPLVWLVRGRIQRRLKQPGEAESSFRRLIEKAPDSPWACQAWGEIALMKDRQEDFAGAIEAIEHCKRVQLAHDEAHWKASEKTHRRMQQMVADITADHLRRWRDEGTDDASRRVALLTGFPRSGTTLLEQVLDAHPDVVSSEERDFIGKEAMHQLTARQGQKSLVEILDALRPGQMDPVRARYFRAMEYLLGESIGDRLHVDKNPAYNLTLPLMLRLFPQTRLIIALRDPRDVVLSCYLRYLPLNTVSVRFLTPQRTAERYALDMTTWLKFRELVEVPWCEVRYEDTVHDVEQQARRVLATLGLEWHADILDYRARLGRDKQVTSPSYEAVAEPIYTRSIGRWQNYEQILAPAFQTLAPLVREFGYEP
jgi:tetratricopeptide (TPR) repeat protein